MKKKILINGKNKRPGHWATHKYKRRSVTRDARSQRWIGWPRLIDLLRKVGGQKRRRDRALIVFIFATGGRINEVLALTRSMFTILEKEILVTGMLKEKDKDYDVRPAFKFPRGEPINQIIESWLDQNDGPLFDIKYDRAYAIIRRIGIYPHWLRSQRAQCLVKEYKLPWAELKAWFDWKSDAMMSVYPTAEFRSAGETRMLDAYTKNS